MDGEQPDSDQYHDSEEDDGDEFEDTVDSEDVLRRKRKQGRPRTDDPILAFQCPFSASSRKKQCTKFRAGTRKSTVSLLG
jgi:hypothetical protein